MQDNLLLNRVDVRLKISLARKLMLSVKYQADIVTKMLFLIPSGMAHILRFCIETMP